MQVNTDFPLSLNTSIQFTYTTSLKNKTKQKPRE